MKAFLAVLVAALAANAVCVKVRPPPAGGAGELGGSGRGGRACCQCAQTASARPSPPARPPPRPDPPGPPSPSQADLKKAEATAGVVKVTVAAPSCDSGDTPLRDQTLCRPLCAKTKASPAVYLGKANDVVCCHCEKKAMAPAAAPTTAKVGAPISEWTAGLPAIRAAPGCVGAAAPGRLVAGGASRAGWAVAPPVLRPRPNVVRPRPRPCCSFRLVLHALP